MNSPTESNRLGICMRKNMIVDEICDEERRELGIFQEF